MTKSLDKDDEVNQMMYGVSDDEPRGKKGAKSMQKKQKTTKSKGADRKPLGKKMYVLLPFNRPLYTN